MPQRGSLMERSRHLLTLVGGNLIVLMVVLIIVDASFWIFFPLNSEVVTEYQQEIAGAKKKISVFTNGLPLRPLTLKTREKADDVFRIICLGASTTEQINQSDEDTWSYLLGQKLAPDLALHGLRVEIGAAGSGGWGAYEALAWATRHLESFAPDLVVILLGINDLSFKGSKGYRYEKQASLSKIHAQELKGPTRTSVGKWLEKHSQIFNRAVMMKRRIVRTMDLKEGRAFNWTGENLNRVIAAYQGMPVSEIRRSDSDPFQEFSDGMEELLSLVSATGAKAVVLGQPTLWKEKMSEAELKSLWFPVMTPQGKMRASPAWMASEMERYNRAQELLAKRRGIPYVPLERLIPKSLEYIYDDCHFTDRGCAAVADAVYPVVRNVALEIAVERETGLSYVPPR